MRGETSRPGQLWTTDTENLSLATELNMVHSSRLNGFHCTPGRVRRKLFGGDFYSEETQLKRISVRNLRGDVSPIPRTAPGAQARFDSNHT